MPKKILFSYENLLPSSAADAEVVLSTAGALCARGHEAIVAVPEPPGHPERFAQEVLDFYGIKAPLRITTLPSKTTNLAVQHAYHAMQFPKHPDFESADFIYARNPVVVMRSLRAGQRVLMDHYRPWGDQFPPLRPFFRSIMTHPRFLGLVVHSAYSHESYRRLGIPSDKLRVVHNGFDPRRMEPALSTQQARDKLGLPQGKRIVTYAGRVNEKKGLDMVLELGRRMPDVVFMIVGSTERGPIEIEADTLDNVLVFPWQPAEAIAPYLYASDVLTIPPSAAPLETVGNTVLPLKLFLYLAAGRVIFAGDNPDTEEILKHDQNAWLVSSGDADEAEAQLKHLLGDQDTLDRLGRACLEQSQQLTWESRAEKIDAFMEECLAREPGTPEAEPWSASACLSDSMKWLASGLSTGNWIYRRPQSQNRQ